MRHDDMIETAVALARRDSPDAQAAAFRQLVDLSLQRRRCEDARQGRRALRALVRLARAAPAPLRDAMIDKAAKGGAGALHLRLFRNELTHHYDRLLQVAELDESEWWRFARRAPAHLHAALLARRDLPGPVREMLSARGEAASRLFVADASLSERAGEVVEKARFVPPVDDDLASGRTPAIDAGRSQVRELLDRIAAFRAREGADRPPEATPTGGPATTSSRWTWRTDESGVFVESPDVPQHLVGHWLTELVTVDAPDLLPRALERRVPFRDVTIEAPGELLAGRWRMSGLPQFDRKTGRFTGYWGSAIAIDAAGVPESRRRDGLFGTGASGEALATMAHEVRTPLNAIIGFAQLIENEILGEAGDAYKQKAGSILEHAEKLLGALDDLTDAARIEQGRYRVGSEPFDVAARARAAIDRYRELTAARDVTLVPLVAHGMPELTADASVFERVLSRLLTSVLAAAGSGETILVVVQPTADAIQVVVSRPRALVGKPDEALLDPAGLVVGEGTPIMGVGFGLKLVASLTGTIGGQFDTRPYGFVVTVPFDVKRRDSEAS